jgi:hypothetical protein
LYAWEAEVAMRDGTIRIIDERLDKGIHTLDSETEAAQSWKDQLKPFEWSDLTSLIDLEKLNPVPFIMAIFGGSQSAGADTKTIATALIDRTVKKGEGVEYRARPEAYVGSGDETMYGGGLESMIEQAWVDYTGAKVVSQWTMLD